MSNQSSSKFKFKSSGISINTVNEVAFALTSSIIANQPNIGIKTPMKLGSGEIYEMHTDIEDQMADNLRNLILTNFGERLGLYDFGANLRELLTEYSNKTDFETEAANRITRAVNKWMPFVTLTDFKTTINEIKNHSLGIAAITLTIKYVIPQINSQQKEIKVNLFVI